VTNIHEEVDVTPSYEKFIREYRKILVDILKIQMCFLDETIISE
jgi:hypothetical protein